MQSDTKTIEYKLNNHFFADIEGEDVTNGNINVGLTVTKTGDAFIFNFKVKGIVIIPCNRCMDEMEYPINTSTKLIVKLGKIYSEESDEIVIIPEKEGVINLAWFLYEIVVLAIPIKHVHVADKCNKQMIVTLTKHMVTAKNDIDSEDENITRRQL